ncbi:MAG: hypothetical protein NZ928_04340 [Endomicrobia bacterium]|nr:hypothetical protein [Endomicrobiia bacterium]MDW8056269.1 hypothetical protein [Elusimicrobiota bacterium]
MLKFIDLFLVFLAGFMVNFVSNIENFYSYVKIKSLYSGIIGFICWMLTGLVFADIITSAENKFVLVLLLSLGGGVGNFYSAQLLKFFRSAKRKNYIKKLKIKTKLLFSSIVNLFHTSLIFPIDNIIRKK